MNKLAKRIALDSMGIFLIIIAVPIGWLPGPGGIPLILIGLGLLAKNNKWARELLNNFEAKFRYYSGKIVLADPRLQLAMDGLGFLGAGLGLYVSFSETGVSRALAAAVVTSSLIVLLLNRGRGVRLYSKIARKKT
jgi:hypothetical protein